VCVRLTQAGRFTETSKTREKLAGNNPQIRQWLYDMMTSRPPPLPKNKEKHREDILDRVEEGWLEEEWARTMP